MERLWTFKMTVLLQPYSDHLSGKRQTQGRKRHSVARIHLRLERLLVTVNDLEIGKLIHSLDYRALRLTTGVTALANGITLGGTAILAACKLEVEDIERAVDATDGGRISCAASWSGRLSIYLYPPPLTAPHYSSPAACPHHAPATLDELQHDLAHLLNAALSPTRPHSYDTSQTGEGNCLTSQTAGGGKHLQEVGHEKKKKNAALAHAALRPANLAVLPARKAWLLNLDCVVLADTGNVHDALFLGARAAMCDTRVPVTRPVEYNAPRRAGVGRGNDDGDDGGGMDTNGAGLDTRHAAYAADFELADYWSEGAARQSQSQSGSWCWSRSWTWTWSGCCGWSWRRWPVCVTLNLKLTQNNKKFPFHAGTIIIRCSARLSLTSDPPALPTSTPVMKKMP
ncbi:hypothetical protein JB92DRAFT_2826031 [Gautieria morchelliformis]|nr:hypothetical protein JB92DRAFT_2826031 [Gautieria morchelliformis]